MNSAKCKCFGLKAAITVEATKLERPGGEVPTINLEVAPKLQGIEGYDWGRKIAVQLTEKELPLLCAVFLGLAPGLHLKRKQKGIEVERQDKAIFLKASAAGKGNLFALPIPPGDAFVMSAFCLEQLKQQSGLGSEGLLLAAIRGIAPLYVNQIRGQDARSA